MNALVLVVLIAAVALVAAGVWFYATRRRRAELQRRFGPEYDRTVVERGDRHGAERELKEREERVKKLEIHPLTDAQSERFAEEWQRLQARFVDAPAESIAAADRLVTEVMRERGYPVGDFEQRAADISVDHPRVVQNYRAALALTGRSTRGEATTEDLRQAMVHYRALFEDLLSARTHTEVKIERAS